ncbi:uncharacterized protein LOC133303590 [Gastrolobium bilobum]|uniref:uncharacterized protein LOC133303590 n=1 Tax=Gastrolobium bilobum TaxID=150636 RepID=UPI002AAFD3D0|nr:uncharacterized protein LOC133303590 [Gastrolobium bilobum]
MELTPLNPKCEESGDAWKVYVDGSSNNKESGAGIILESPEGVTIEHSLNLGFPTSNNQAEYEALIAGLIQAKEHGARRVKIFSDSQLMTSQIEGKYQAKGPLLMKYLNKVQEMMADFDEVQVTHIPRGGNSRADILSKLVALGDMSELLTSKYDADRLPEGKLSYTHPKTMVNKDGTTPRQLKNSRQPDLELAAGRNASTCRHA